MEEKTVPLLNLSDIDGGRASLRRRLSLLDLNLRQVASVLLTPTEFADWSATSLDAMLSPRSARSSRDLASPSGRERKFDALLSHQRTGSTVDRLAVPCRPPLFLGPDFLNSGLDSLASGSRRSTTSMVLRRLSTFSPRRDKARDSKALGCTGGLVVAVLRDLLMARFELDKDWVLRSVVDRDQLASQQIAFLTRIKAVASMLEQFAPLGPEASEMKEKLVLLAGHDRQLYGTVLSWLELHQPPQVRLHLVDIADLLRTALPDEWIALSVQHGLDANEAVAYHNAQWALEPACLPDQLSDRCLQGKPVAAWASGGMASVHKLTYQVDAELQTVVWKAEDAAASTLATDLMGITATQSRGGVPPHFSGRSVASYRISALLGLDLIPETRWSVHQGEVGTAMDLALGHAPSSKGPFYLTLDTETAQALKAIDQGLEALAKRFGFCSVTWAEATAHTLVFDHFLVEFVFDRHGDYVMHPDGTRRESRRRLCAWVRQDFGNPTLRRDLTRLQWLDHLTGQVDRNPMNYLVHWREDGSAVLSAIDNDLSFPAEAVLPEPTMINQVWLPAMPEVVDEVLAEAILGAKEEDWRGCLQGLLLPVEVQMACARLAAVKDRLKGLQAQQRVVGTGERAWSSQQMSEWLGLLELRDMFRGGEEDQPKEWALEGIWRRASQRSYLLRDATKQVMLLMGRENGPLFDPARIRAFIRDDLLKG
jgi:hypothetical protein